MWRIILLKWDSLVLSIVTILYGGGFMTCTQNVALVRS